MMNMKKTSLVTAMLAIALTACGQKKGKTTSKDNDKKMESTQTSAPDNVHGFVVQDINGKDFPLSNLKGKKVLIVNVASKCGLTPQYKQLENIFKTYGGDKFVIIGFPANNFGSQEPGSNEEIATFCEKNYGVSFLMMSKISVKGSDIHPLYKWLTQKKLNGVEDNEISWNFEKILIDENGKYVTHYEPTVKPDDERIIKWIKGN